LWIWRQENEVITLISVSDLGERQDFETPGSSRINLDRPETGIGGRKVSLSGMWSFLIAACQAFQ